MARAARINSRPRAGVKTRARKGDLDSARRGSEYAERMATEREARGLGLRPRERGCGSVMRDTLRAAARDAAERRDAVAIATLRLIDAAIEERDRAAKERGGAPVDDREIVAMLGTMIEQRERAIDRLESSARIDDAEQERTEIDVIRTLLPAPMGEAAIARAVGDAIERLGADKLKDAGPVMAELKKRYAGRMDFALAKRILCERLD